MKILLFLIYAVAYVPVLAVVCTWRLAAEVWWQARRWM